MAIKKYEDFSGGLNLNDAANIEDNELAIAKNVFYNNNKQLQTRRGFRKFGNSLGSSPITSYFYRRHDSNLDRFAICTAGSDMYKYDEATGDWNSIKTGLAEFERKALVTSHRTRWDFGVYKNVAYMGNGVDPYSSYDGTTFSYIGYVSVGVSCTFDSSTDYINATTHGLVTGDNVLLDEDGGTLPAELSEGVVYYVTKVDADNFQVSEYKNGPIIDFTDDGTTVVEFHKLTVPPMRYTQYLGDRLYATGDDQNPSTLYYTDATPTDGTTVTSNAVVVGGDENGIINGLHEYAQTVLVFKSDKIYAVNVTAPSVEAIDSQTGGYSDRSIHSVGNTLVYFNERGIDSLTKRSGVGGVNGLESDSLSENVRSLLEDIKEIQYNGSTGWYIKTINNFYYTFDTNNDNVPDTTLVYNSSVGSRTQYTLPNLYDYGQYLNEDGTVQHLFSSALGGQMYQFEYGFDDDGQDIEVDVQTKDFDFEDPVQLKIFDMIDITGYKQEGGSIDVSVIIDDESSSMGMVTDSNISVEAPVGILGVDPIGQDSIGGGSTDGLQLYPFTVKMKMYNRGSKVAVRLQSSGVQRILEKMRIGVNGEVVEIFSYDNII